MVNTSALINTDPGLVALGVLVIGIIMAIACIFKFKANTYMIIATAVALILGITFVAAVLGYIDLPLIDYFNGIEVTPEVEP